MLYYFFDWLHNLHVPGTGAFLYTSTRVALSFLLSLILTFVLGKKIIRFLQKKQIGDTIRELGIEGQTKKIGTPTMGGIIIILSIVIPSLLLGRLNNLYLWLLIVTTLWLGGVGLIDDYIKVFKHNKEGIPAWGKLFGQIVLGIAIGGVLYFSPQSPLETPKSENSTHTEITTSKVSNKVKTLDTTVPFFKNHNFNYSYIVPSCLKEYAEPVGWFFFIVMSVLVITSVSNGVNMTDGLDGLATGCSAIVGAVLLLLTYVGTHTGISSYLNIMYIPQSEEIVIFLGTFVGATVAFLWFNAYPAQVFMGDTGSLSIGGIIA
ncbi:MAG TPA: phospho-N-acetylmuramoyl-pentapeptide-transferase, partial [Porphyromonadaceae bacterium]|nr:phospho-N-acetylmuramoyl-pentapeptide-transferase [Porphyromonadaceae bacterium]